jgi:hypothetical protein
MRFNVVMANPPFSLDKWGAEGAADPYKRFHCGIPPASKGEFHRQAIDVCRSSGYRTGEATALFCMSVVEEERDNLPVAQSLLQEALEIDQLLDGPNQKRDKAALERVKEKLRHQT